MATFTDIIHLPCVIDALLRDRHPLLTSRDLAALAMSGALGSPDHTRQATRAAWEVVARDVERAMSEEPCTHHAGLGGPYYALADVQAFLQLDAMTTKKVAERMGVRQLGSVAENTSILFVT